MQVTSPSNLSKSYRFGYTVRNKAYENRELSKQIDAFLSDYEIELPDNREDFERYRSRIFHYDQFGDALDSRFADLVKLRYAVSRCRGYYAHFAEGSKERLVPMAFWYSRHKLCHVWNWRKSQLIRSRYMNYLKEARDASGMLLIEHYRPAHLVLTVPHEKGLWKGKRFYAREIIAAFTQMRKREFWKEMIYAGEYGVEIKRGRSGNGLHIHIHSFILQNPAFQLNQVRDAIEANWRDVTGNKTGYSGIHYETLYSWEKLPDGSMQKRYIRPGESDLSEYLAGVMECIKYHFKPDALEAENGDFDILLIDEILSNTKNVRLYSRFGKFYRESALNFNRLETDPEAIDTNEGEPEAEPLGNTEGVEERIDNPFTGLPAARQDFGILVGSPLGVMYKKRPGAHGKRSEVIEMNPSRYEPFAIVPKGLSLKAVIRLDLTGKLREEIEKTVVPNQSFF